MGEKTIVEVEWLSNGSYEARDPEGHRTLIQTGQRTALSPSQLFLASLAACSMVDVVTIIGKKRKKLGALRARVEGERVEGFPTRYRKITVTYFIEGSDVTKEDSISAIELSQNKYCSVSLTVKNGAEVEWKLEDKVEQK
ncbi:MAG: OsmC family protein [Conexivisphaerales archaeon]